MTSRFRDEGQAEGENLAKKAVDLDGLGRVLAQAGRKRPPVHLWNPPFCGDIDLRIKADGTWHYLGTPIGRPALVHLFASVLRKDPDRYVLVTPVERVGIIVEDVPFLAVSMRAEGEGQRQNLTFTSNVGDEIQAGPQAPLRFSFGKDGALKPYILMRDQLWARLTRPLLYDLIEHGESAMHAGAAYFGVWSGGMFFPICPADEIEALA